MELAGNQKWYQLNRAQLRLLPRGAGRFVHGWPWRLTDTHTDTMTVMVISWRLVNHHATLDWLPCEVKLNNWWPSLETRHVRRRVDPDWHSHSSGLTNQWCANLVTPSTSDYNMSTRELNSMNIRLVIISGSCWKKKNPFSFVPGVQLLFLLVILLLFCEKHHTKGPSISSY